MEQKQTKMVMDQAPGPFDFVWWANLFRHFRRDYLRYFFAPSVVISYVALHPLTHILWINALALTLCSGWIVSAAQRSCAGSVPYSELSFRRWGRHVLTQIRLAVFLMGAAFIFALPLLIFTEKVYFRTLIGVYLLIFAFLAFVRCWPLYFINYIYRGGDKDPGLEDSEDRNMSLVQLSTGMTAGRFDRLKSGIPLFFLMSFPMLLNEVFAFGELRLEEPFRALMRLVLMLVWFPFWNLIACERAWWLAARYQEGKTQGYRPPGTSRLWWRFTEPDDVVEEVEPALISLPPVTHEPENLDRETPNPSPQPDPKFSDPNVVYDLPLRPLSQAPAHRDPRWEQKRLEDLYQARRDEADQLLDAALRENQPQWLEEALVAGADIQALDSSGRSPLFRAVAWSQTEMVRLMLARHPDLSRWENGRSLLHLACYTAHDVDLIRVLQLAGADLAAKDAAGFSCLHYACRRPDDEPAFAAEILDAGFSLDTSEPGLPTPVMEACRVDNKAVTHLLLKRGASLHNLLHCSSYPGWNAAAFAAAFGSAELLNLLFQSGADPDFRTGQGRTLLMIAAAYQNQETVAFLLDRGLDPNLRDHSGFSALDLSQQQDRPSKAVSSLLNLNGAIRTDEIC